MRDSLTLPWSMASCQSQSALDEFLARLSVIVGGFIAPGDLWMTSFPSRVFSLSSMTSISDTSPLISENWAISMRVDLDREQIRGKRIGRQIW